MSLPFDAAEGLIVVPAELVGPSGSSILRLALDTGATSTLLNAGMLLAVGYDPGSATDRVQITTGSGVEYVPRVKVDTLTALGQRHCDFSVVSHTLPPSAGVDGLLGLDFLRGTVLEIDFRAGKLSIR